MPLALPLVSGRDAAAEMTSIDGYGDLEVIGQGGFAVVYKARQMSVGRDVAIKLLTDPSPDDDLIRRFQRESRAVGALSWHPHIAAVVDAGSTAQGQAFIVFELLQGGSLEDRIEQGPMHWTSAVSSMIQVADAVEAAHRADVLHRDIKPANILLDRLGVAKLGDFGIASMQDGNKTATGMLATTVVHAAPELFSGETASAATDVYALGSTLHTLLTGSPPFLPPSGQRLSHTISRIISEPPPEPDPAIVPEQISTVIAHALAKQPEYRPRTAAAFGRALQNAQRALGHAYTAMPVTDSQPVTPAAPPRPTVKMQRAESAERPAPPQPPAQSRPAPPAQSPPQPPAQSRPAPPQPPAQSRPAPPQPPAQSELVAATESDLEHASFVPPAATITTNTKPFGRTIVALSTVAALLAATVLGLFLWQRSQAPDPIAQTAGGALIRSHNALDVTEMPPPRDESQALDQDESTYWGIAQAPNGTTVSGTTYVIALTEEQTVLQVGISNGESVGLGRVDGVIWGTSIEDLERRESGANVVEQTLLDQPGSQLTPFRVTTDQIVLALTGVHGDGLTAGIAEILIEVQE